MPLQGVDASWLVSRPIAHRGLHARDRGIIENSLGAAEAAVARGYAIECDIRLTRDGVPVIFHDETLDRLTPLSGRLDALTAADLHRATLKGSGEAVPTVAAFLACLAGRVPLVCEIKSLFNGDMRLVEAASRLVDDYDGPLVFESFDPDVVAWLRRHPSRIRPRAAGMAAQADFDDPEWDFLGAARKRELAEFLHFDRSRPDFLSFEVKDLATAVPVLCRKGLGLPVTAWTVRTEDDRRRAREGADQIVFEGFEP